jgi:heme/copper-type cytochrome/quinol oxidase subunit 1
MDILLQSIIPQLPTNRIETIVFVVAALGAILLTYSIFVEAEHRRDLMRIIGAGSMLVYALYINNVLFIIAMGGVFLASLVEFVEIYLGLHYHSREHLEDYKKYAFLGKKKK